MFFIYMSFLRHWTIHRQISFTVMAESVLLLSKVLCPPLEQLFAAIIGQLFFLRPPPGRLVTVPYALNFLITLRMVDTGTSRSLEMNL